MPRRRPGRAGASLGEALVLAALLGLLAAGVVLPVRRAIAREAPELAARRVAGEIRLLRSQAIATAVSRALLFDRAADGEWRIAIAHDGDGDGVRADDVRRRIDPIVDGPTPFAERFDGARLAFHASIAELRSPPPTSAPLGRLDDPVRLGLTDTLSFTARGSMTSGTLYITDGLRHERQIAVVAYGNTGRTRVWEYDVRMRRWIPMF